VGRDSGHVLFLLTNFKVCELEGSAMAGTRGFGCPPPTLLEYLAMWVAVSLYYAMMFCVYALASTIDEHSVEFRNVLVHNISCLCQTLPGPAEHCLRISFIIIVDIPPSRACCTNRQSSKSSPCMVGMCIVSSPSRVQPREDRELIAESLNSESLIAEHANTTREEVQTLYSG
jgi:hypothetical protein